MLTPLLPEVLRAVARTIAPDLVLHRLERFVEVSGTPLSLYARLIENPVLGEHLLGVLSYSDYLTDVLVRNPEYLYWLFEETPFLKEPLDKPTLREILHQDTQVTGSRDEYLDTLRRAQRRELLRLGTAEILKLKEVDQIGLELSDLADVILEMVLDSAMQELVERYGRPRDERGRPAHFCIVCLGKHGGQELNYYSDIDLIFAYDEEGQTRPGRSGRSVPNHEFFHRLGERLIQILSAATPEGSFYRVDMRLRPEGEKGALVRSLRSYWIYYETKGELWERQMLIKARCAAGSKTLWKRFQEILVPFTYPAHFSVSPQEEIRHIKERIEAHILERPSRENNIKLRAGGIRDIEFVVQCLQLLNGRINPQARVQGTLQAIARLQRAEMLSAAEAKILSRAYMFFRRLENLLQIKEGRPVYAVPEGGEEQEALARVLGLADGAALGAELHGHLGRVKSVYDELFYGEEKGVDRLDWLLQIEPGSPRARDALQGFGFADGVAAHRNVLQLANAGMVTGAARQHLEALLPELIGSLGGSPDPDQGLVRFARIVEVYGAPGMFYELLRAYPGFRKLLITLCGSSPFLAGLIQRDPGLLDGLVTPGDGGGFAEEAGWKGDLAAVGRYRNQELLRIGTEDLLGLTPVEETFLRLTELAEGVLRMIYREAWRRLVRRHGKPRDKKGKDACFACWAGGKFGGREMDFGSDLDLFFVYEGDGHTGRTRADNSVFFIELAQEIIRLLQEGGLYQVDARLRPEGRNAPMAVSLPAYCRYLRDRAAVWERLALSRARMVVGDGELGGRVQRAMAHFVFGGPVDASFAAEVRDLRRRMEPRQERGKALQVDIKRGPGGLVDIEFIAQIMVLKQGRKDRKMRLKSTRQALVRLLEMQCVNEAEGKFLLAAYDRFREVEKGMRMASEQASNVLPTGGDLARLGQVVGQHQPEAFQAEIEDLMKETRHLFERLLAAQADGE